MTLSIDWHRGHSQDVIDVENTVSPQMLRGAPKERPVNDWPVFRWSAAGSEVFEAWEAKPRERRAIRVKLRASMLLKANLMTEQREYEVAEVTGGASERVSASKQREKKGLRTRRECFA